MEYFKRILLTERLSEERLKELFNKPMGKFYIGYLSVSLKSNTSNTILNDNLNLIIKEMY